VTFTSSLDPFGRLVAQCAEELHVERLGVCWLGHERSKGRGGYLQCKFRVPGLGMKPTHFSAHLVTWVIDQIQSQDLDAVFLAYCEFRASGLVLDHLCEQPACRRPSHLEPVTQKENMQRMRDRRAARLAARGEEFAEESKEPLPF
jgi:hypothetical protein